LIDRPCAVAHHFPTDLRGSRVFPSAIQSPNTLWRSALHFFHSLSALKAWDGSHVVHLPSFSDFYDSGGISDADRGAGIIHWLSGTKSVSFTPRWPDRITVRARIVQSAEPEMRSDSVFHRQLKGWWSYQKTCLGRGIVLGGSLTTISEAGRDY
jgi:hypothetical protein